MDNNNNNNGADPHLIAVELLNGWDAIPSSSSAAQNSTAQGKEEKERKRRNKVVKVRKEMGIIRKRMNKLELELASCLVIEAGTQPLEQAPLQGWGSVASVLPSAKVKSGLSLLESGEHGHEEEVVNLAEPRIALKLFPEELWVKILTYITEPKDRWNCANAVDLFGALLHPVGWMFFGETLPYLYRHLPINKLLECRSVCKTWRNAFDSFLEDHPSLRPHNPLKVDPRTFDFVTPTKQKEIGRYEGLHSISLFRNFFTARLPVDENGSIRRASDENPFLGRGVEVTHSFNSNGLEANTEAVAAWWDWLFNFLEVFGMEIYYLKLDCPNYVNCVSRQKFEELFNAKLFQLAPNLRSLIIFNMYGLAGSDIPHFRPGQLVLPAAPYLESLQFLDDCDHAKDSPFLPFFNRYHTQLCKLDVGVHTWWQVFYLDWPLLTDLRLDEVKGIEDLDLVMFPPGLTKLALCLMEKVPLRGLVDFVNELSGVAPRLHTLRLQGMFAFDGPLNTTLVTSGSLKTLELIRGTSEYPVKSVPGSMGKVIAAFPFIQHLHVCYTSSSGDSTISVVPEDNSHHQELMMKIAEAAKETIEVLDIERWLYTGRTPLSPPPPGAVYQSNLWELLSQLRVFTFQWGVFTREEHERASSNATPSSKQLE